MSFEIAALATGAASGSAAGGIAAGAAAPGTGATPQQAGYGASLADAGHFERALDAAAAAPAQGPSAAAQTMMKPFEHINDEALRLTKDADAARAAGHDMSPGEVVQLTVRCQEFSFHCQLLSNVANRTSDGLSQLFRQQG